MLPTKQTRRRERTKHVPASDKTLSKIKVVSSSDRGELLAYRDRSYLIERPSSSITELYHSTTDGEVGKSMPVTALKHDFPSLYKLLVAIQKATETTFNTVVPVSVRPLCLVPEPTDRQADTPYVFVPALDTDFRLFVEKQVHSSTEPTLSISDPTEILFYTIKDPEDANHRTRLRINTLEDRHHGVLFYVSSQKRSREPSPENEHLKKKARKE